MDDWEVDLMGVGGDWTMVVEVNKRERKGQELGG